jgi:NAD(P)-dependent dehydrogenase (short-subunit alcohol dehydrogenase family)
MGQLDGRVIIVTGAAQGIGVGYAQGLAEQGARIVAADAQDPEPVAATIRQAGGEAIGVKADVTDDGAIKDLVAASEDAFGGRIDGLINNAALFTSLERRRFEDFDLDEFDDVMRVNVRGVWQMTRVVTPVMRRQKYGKIVNIASGTVYKGSPMLLHYVASKGAIVAMSRALAKELGDDNICVNTIAPGLTQTDVIMAQGRYSNEHFEASVASRALKRLQSPEDLVGAAAFLMSTASDFMTGQVLVVDGGSVFN